MSNSIFEKHWIGPFDEHWARELHAMSGQRTTFLQNLVDAEDSSRACEALRALLKGLDPDQVTRVFFNHVGDITILNSWLGPYISDIEDRHQNAAPLLRTACEMGLNLAYRFKVKLPYSNDVFETTEIGEKIAHSPMLDKIELEHEMDAVGVLLEQGAPLDEWTCHGLLVLDDVKLAGRWFEFLSERSKLSASQLLQFGNRGYVHAGTLAYFSALVAHEAVDATSGQGLRPLRS